MRRMPASTADGAARRRRAATLAPLALVVGLVAGACSSDPPDPAEVRRDQVRTRLEASFSDAQADCIVGALDEDTIEALTGSADLDPDSEQFTQYSNVVLLCSRDQVASDEATTTTDAATTTAEPTTTEAPTTTGG